MVFRAQVFAHYAQKTTAKTELQVTPFQLTAR